MISSPWGRRAARPIAANAEPVASIEATTLADAKARAEWFIDPVRLPAQHERFAG
jgi:hypothetical protein